MPVAALALPRLQLFDANGDPLSGGKLATYQGGTSTPLSTYNSADGLTPNPNPTIADAGGFLDVYLLVATSYKLQVRNAADVVLSTIDGIILPVPQSNTLTNIDDISGTVTAGNQTSDPGEQGSEVLATNAATELQQLRFVIQEMKGVLWRNTYTVRNLPVVLVAEQTANATWTPTGTTSWRIIGLVPDGWRVGTPLVLVMNRRSATGVGTANMSWVFYRVRDNDLLNPSGTADISFAPGNTLEHQLQLSVPGTNFLPGDSFIVVITRNGDAANDTDTGNIFADGAWLNYQGIASR